MILHWSWMHSRVALAQGFLLLLLVAVVPTSAWQCPVAGGAADGASSTHSRTHSHRGVLRRSELLAGSLAGGVLARSLALRGGRAPLSMAVVDSAVHVWKRDSAYPWAKEAAANPPATDASGEELIALMDANGVDKTVIVQPICYRYDNSYVKDTIQRWPTRLAGVARVDPEDERADDKLESLTAAGFVGVRFGPVEQSWWESKNMLRILLKAQTLRIPVLLFLGKDGGSKIPWVLPVLQQVPDLLVVIDHMADVPPSDEAQIENLLGLAALPKVHVKISHTWALSTQEYPWSDAQQLVKKVVEAFGAERCMFASDWPVCMMPSWPGGNTSYADTVKLATAEYAKFLSEDDLSRILGGTAASIWFPEPK